MVARGMTLLSLLAFALAGLAADDKDLVIDIPKVNHIVIDGDPADWGTQGFHEALLPDSQSRCRPPDDFAPTFRLGWDERGVLLLVMVRDDNVVEFEEPADLWQRDSIEVFMSENRGVKNLFQVELGTGADPRYPHARHYFYDMRRNKEQLPALTVTVAGRKVPDGYVFEALFPWANLGITPVKGATFGFQLFVNDADADGGWARGVWFPRGLPFLDAGAMHAVRLADTASPSTYTVVASGEYEGFRRVRIDVNALSRYAKKRVEVKEGRRTLANGVLATSGGRASLSLTLPMPRPGKSYGELAVLVGGQRIGAVTLPDADDRRMKARTWVEPVFQPYVFDSDTFPPCTFEHPREVEDLIGPYTIQTTFYDREYRQVYSAGTPGRYGAVIKIIPEQGRTITRYRTLFRTPESLDWRRWEQASGTSTFLPKAFGVNPAVVTEQADLVTRELNMRLVGGLGRDAGGAVLLAALNETQPGGGPKDWVGLVDETERQWWVGFKRKMYGMDTRYPDPFVCPRPIEGPPAPVLREGTPREAGINPEAIPQIDALCNAWAENSNEAFAVCIARRGVIVLHKAYGMRSGKPMTVDTPSYMASITKTMSATLFMMLVDQGVLDLDDPVEQYVPPMRGIPVPVPLTFRHCFTHTNGGWDHWGDWQHDMEEMAAEHYPDFPVGKQHFYNGIGYALSGKVIELVSGEALPRFYRNHLLNPLGCPHTRVSGTYSGAMSTPLEIAKIGQVLLNKGAYGEMRFFSEDTFAKMLPEKLTHILGPDTDVTWGIGLYPFGSDDILGHGAASGATFRIFPKEDLVVVMTRNDRGKYRPGTSFNGYHEKFLNLITASVQP